MEDGHEKNIWNYTFGAKRLQLSKHSIFYNN